MSKNILPQNEINTENSTAHNSNSNSIPFDAFKKFGDYSQEEQKELNKKFEKEKKRVFDNYVEESIIQLRYMTLWCSSNAYLSKNQRQKLSFEASHLIKKVANPNQQIEVKKGFYI